VTDKIGPHSKQVSVRFPILFYAINFGLGYSFDIIVGALDLTINYLNLGDGVSPETLGRTSVTIHGAGEPQRLGTDTPRMH
jgi:hypothetical protein